MKRRRWKQTLAITLSAAMVATGGNWAPLAAYAAEPAVEVTTGDTSDESNIPEIPAGLKPGEEPPGGFGGTAGEVEITSLAAKAGSNTLVYTGKEKTITPSDYFNVPDGMTVYYTVKDSDGNVVATATGNDSVTLKGTAGAYTITASEKEIQSKTEGSEAADEVTICSYAWSGSGSKNLQINFY